MSDAVLTWLFTYWESGSFDHGEPSHASPRSRRYDVEQTERDATDRVQEREWIAGMRAGSVDAFHAVFDTYAHRLHDFAQLWVPHDVAEDLVQDVLFDVWQRRGELYPHHDNLTGHLFAAVRHRAIDYVRHHQVVQRAEASQTWTVPPGMGTGPQHPDVALSTHDIRGAISAVLAALPALQRAAMMLRWGQDMPFAEIAAVLSISENAAKLHVSRGRKAIAPLLKRLLDE